ncbi:hypothetical protein [Streptomyces sp. NRRL S-340]|uniref:hypothetical protein n=1 Tax=Streptomyces sp. NRRL S-340 TaxID=1463901 RepID=UPI0006914336|nr:hypothetical protein [Streptomyces sp. NRRL S-340]
MGTRKRSDSRYCSPRRPLIPLYHPIWADADPDDITYAVSRAAHGNFRNWARLTALTHTALDRTGRPRVDQEVLRWVFSKLASPH